jgi:hypothetical protein
MPIACDPNATCDIWLDTDEAKPIETRPVFIARFVTKRQNSELLRLAQAAYDEQDPVRSNELLHQALAIGIIGWRNQRLPDGSDPGPFAIDKLDDVLTDRELWLLAWTLPRKVTLGEADRKGFRLPPQSDSDSSVAVAAAGNATTSQAPTAPPASPARSVTAPATIAQPAAAGE